MELRWETNIPEYLDGSRPKSSTSLDTAFAYVDIEQQNTTLYPSEIIIRFRKNNRIVRYQTTEKSVSDLINDVMYYFVLHTTLEEVTEFEKKEILKQWRFK